MSVDEGDMDVAPPIKIEVGQVYYVRWRDGSENLFLMKMESCYQVLASHTGASDLPAIRANQIAFNINWTMVSKVKRVPLKNLPLYVSWKVNKYFTRLIDKYAKKGGVR